MRALHHDKPILISIAGDLGSGKSLLTGALVGYFGAKRYSTGDAQRKIASEMGLTTLELNRLAEQDTSIDDKIDSVFKDLALTDVNLVVDSRMAFHFLPKSFKIRLEVHPKVAAERIYADTGRIGEAKGGTVLEIEAGIIARKASEQARFMNYYGVDIENHAGYDLVVNTTGVAPEAVASLVIGAVEAWAKGGAHAKGVWISPKQLFVGQDVAQAAGQSEFEQGSDKIIALRARPCMSEGTSTGLCPLIVKAGAGIVAQAIADGQELVRVEVEAGVGQVPAAQERATWEALNAFSYMDVWGFSPEV